MNDIEYSTISLVLETWDAARATTKDYECKFGKIALEQLFVLEPRTKAVFGLDKSDAHRDAAVEHHAKAFASLLDSVLQTLGPDIEFTKEILNKNGIRHKKMGIEPVFFHQMGHAIRFALEKMLGNKLTSKEIEAWEEIYGAISQQMIMA